MMSGADALVPGREHVGPGFLTGAQPYDLGNHNNPGTGVAVLVAKISPNCRDLVYATVLSASGYSEQWARGIAVDAAGAAYVTGLLNSSFNNAECGCFTDFPTTPGAYQRDIPPHYEPGDEGALIVGPQLFVLKLDPTGTVLEDSTLLGGSGWGDAGGIAVGPSGTAYVSGTTYSTDFQTTTGQQPGEEGDAFVVQLNADGSQLLASRLVQGSSADYAAHLVTHGGDVYLFGQTASRDLPVISDLRGAAPDYPFLGYIAKLSGSGLSPRVPDVDADFGSWPRLRRSVTDVRDRQWLTQNLFVSENAFQKTMAGHGDGYLALIAADGSAIRRAAYIGGRNEESLGRIAILPSGDPVISGYTFTNDYPTTPDAVQTTLGGPEFQSTDMVVSRFSADLSQLMYSTYIGGSLWDFGGAMAVDPTGAVWIAGNTQSPNFPGHRGCHAADIRR